TESVKSSRNSSTNNLKSALLDIEITERTENSGEKQRQNQNGSMLDPCYPPNPRWRLFLLFLPFPFPCPIRVPDPRAPAWNMECCWQPGCGEPTRRGTTLKQHGC